MKNEYTITKRLTKSWEREWWFNSVGNTASLIFLCSFVAFLFALPYPVTYLIEHEAVYEMVYHIIFAIFHSLALLMAYLTFYSPSAMYANPNLPYYHFNSYKINSKNYCVRKWKRSIELTESEITVYDHTSVLKFEYSTIKRVKVRRKLVTIFLKSGLELRLYKKAFVTGSWDECKKLLSRKTSVKIK